MDRLLMERSLIERELDCSQHDPIEVVLIFDKSNALGGAGYAESDETAKPQKKKRRRKRPQKSRPPRPPRQSSSPGRAKRPERNKSKKQVNSAEVFYDPTKLKFVFSTPSPLSRKFLEMRDRTAASGEELAIYDMADMPVSTGSAGTRPTPSSHRPTAIQSGEDRRVLTFPHPVPF